MKIIVMASEYINTVADMVGVYTHEMHKEILLKVETRVFTDKRTIRYIGDIIDVYKNHLEWKIDIEGRKMLSPGEETAITELDKGTLQDSLMSML